MSEADPCRRNLDAVAEARLFARDALRAAWEVLPHARDQGTAMMAVFCILAAEVVAPELVREDGPGDRRPAN
ncbi:hypothetical protein [Methylobacterium hispanicum]|uniref:hypothetical protein n=1 Tax=Methylobacterium hispanicum TaxID=270350 RepID=UPI002F2FE016